VYGADRLGDDCCQVTGYKPNNRVVLGALVGLFLAVVFFVVLMLEFGVAINWTSWCSDVVLAFFLTSVLPVSDMLQQRVIVTNF
jgi:hypothetical protein